MLETTPYLDHFEFGQAPLLQEPDPDIFFQGAGHPAILQSLLDDIHAGSPLLKLTGREGVGKTLLSLLIARRLETDPYDIIVLDHPAGSYEDLLRVICPALNKGIKDDSDPRQYVREFRALLQDRKSRRKKVLLIIDDAEKIFLATLERLVKMISHPDEAEVLQILLIGRLELDHNLDQLKIYCANVAIQAGYILEPMDLEETKKYLQYRLQAAKIPGREPPSLFDDDAAASIYLTAGGNIRLINTLADKGLKEAWAKGKSRVESELIPPPQDLKKCDSSIFFQIRSLIVRNKWWAVAASFHLLVFFVTIPPGEGEKKQTPAANEKISIGEIVIDIPVAPVTDDQKLPARIKKVEQATPPPAEENLDDVSRKSVQNQEISPAEEPIKPEPVLPREKVPLPSAGQTTVIAEAAPPPAVESKSVELKEVLKPRESKKKIESAKTELIVVEAQTRKKKKQSIPEEAKAGDEAAAPDATQLFNERLRATSNWLAWSYRGGYTIQLMMLTADDAEENLKNILIREQYASVRNDMYIIRRNSPPALFVYYGMYETLEEARQARNNLPPLLSGHQPYALSIQEALKKTEE